MVTLAFGHLFSQAGQTRKKRAYFLKKEAKNFCARVSVAGSDIGRVCKRAKVFWFFFSKNNSFLAFLHWLGLKKRPKPYPRKARRMIELVVVYCLSADLTHCVEKRDPATSYGDPIACMMSAQLSAQAYLAEHPKWQLTRWRCEVDEPKRLPT